MAQAATKVSCFKRTVGQNWIEVYTYIWWAGERKERTYLHAHMLQHVRLKADIESASRCTAQMHLKVVSEQSELTPCNYYNMYIHTHVLICTCSTQLHAHYPLFPSGLEVINHILWFTNPLICSIQCS